MAFGYKVSKISFNNEYTIESLYEAIKGYQFEAGQPQLVKYLANTVIVFPALNSKNQVQIMSTSMKKKPTQKYVIQKGDELSAEGAVKNLALGSLTKSYSSLRSALGDAPKECIRLVDATHAELTSMGL